MSVSELEGKLSHECVKMAHINEKLNNKLRISAILVFQLKSDIIKLQGELVARNKPWYSKIFD